MTIKEYKWHNSLKIKNLRDNMSNLELGFNMLAKADEISVTPLSK